MSATFISYRRNDSAGHTGRLYDHLCKALGENSVFRDIDTIKPGADFVEAVRNGIQRCSSLIVVIGNHWLTAEDDSGRRIDHPLDYVRLEIGSALKQGIQVIPVLVEGAKMPDPADLPEEISSLARRQALQLSDDRWDYDVSRLISALETPLEQSGKPDNSDSDSSDKIIATPADNLTSKENQVDHTNRFSVVITLSLLLTLISALIIWIWPEEEQLGINTHIIEREVIQDEKKNISVNENKIIHKAEKQNERELNSSLTEPMLLQKEKEIERLLVLADENVSRLQLTAPSNDNAVEKYRRILELDPGHTAALHGLEQVSRKYSELALQAVESNKLSKADTYLKLAKSINPDIQEIHQAERVITSIRQRREEALQQTQNKQKQTDHESREQISYQLDCRNNCQERNRECEQNLQKYSCPVEDIQRECERTQRECLNDPQTLLTWGEFALSAECLSRHNQCMDQNMAKCEEIQNHQLTMCGTELQQCLNACQ
jgi:hypothetical protein